MRLGPVPGWLPALLVGGTLAGLLWLERRRPLRRAVEPKLRRDTRNLVVATASAAAVRLAETPIVLPLAELVERRRWGLLPGLGPPTWLEAALAVVLLDYTLYLWHIVTHRVPLLWRFHRVHHVDLDLDATTALRFHFGEILASVPYRAAQVIVIGVAPPALVLWQTATLLAIMFHHADVELPIGLERWLARLIVTPRMHGIHHSIAPEEQDSNWSSGLSVWDRLHGTLRLNVPQAEVIIGVWPDRAPAAVTLPKILAMPFREQPPRPPVPEGASPRGDRPPVPPNHLLA